MGVKINSQGAAFVIDNNQSVFHLEKSHIRKISIIRDDTLRIETGNEPLKNIYIPFDAVTEPLFESLPLLLNWLSNEIKTTASGGTSGGATEATLLLVLDELRIIKTTGIDIKTLLAKLTDGNGGMGNPDMVDDTQINTIYRGWTASIHGQTSSPEWAIEKTLTDKTPNEVLWADGNKLYDNSWNNRYSLNYF